MQTVAQSLSAVLCRNYPFRAKEGVSHKVEDILHGRPRHFSNLSYHFHGTGTKEPKAQNDTERQILINPRILDLQERKK